MPADPLPSAHDADGMALLSEEQAAKFVGWAVRRFRKFELPYVRPDGARRKDQWLYRLDVLTAYRDTHGTSRDVRAEAARRTHTKLTYNGEAYSKYPHYDRWRTMVDRCTKPHHPDFPDYGGRGIKVYEPWLDPLEFFAYVDAFGAIPSGYSLNRVDNDGNYEPDNLEFTDFEAQNLNRRGWADPDSYVACCWCIDCEHDEVTCPVEAFDWAAARRAFGTDHLPPFDKRKARKNYNRTRLPSVIRSVIRLPDPRPDRPNWIDDLLDQAELDQWLRDGWLDAN